MRWLGAQGGVSITGGHNPAAWNALKFVRGDGLYLNTTQAEELLDIVHQGEFEKATWDRIRTGVAEQDAIGHHLEVLTAAFDVDADAAPRPAGRRRLLQRRLDVAVAALARDARVHGAGRQRRSRRRRSRTAPSRSPRPWRS